MLHMMFFATSTIVLRSSGAKFAILLSRISSGYFHIESASLISLGAVWTMSSLMEKEKMSWLSISLRVLETRAKVAFVTMLESMLRFWEAMSKGGKEEDLEGHRGTTSVTTSCAVSSLKLYASCCFSLRVWMSFLALLRSLGKIS